MFGRIKAHRRALNGRLRCIAISTYTASAAATQTLPIDYYHTFSVNFALKMMRSQPPITSDGVLRSSGDSKCLQNKFSVRASGSSAAFK